MHSICPFTESKANAKEKLKVINSTSHTEIPFINLSSSYKTVTPTKACRERKIFEEVNIKRTVLCTVFSNSFLFTSANGTISILFTCDIN